MLRVISKKDGFRRGGRAWTGVTEIPASEVARDQLAALKGEPMLVVQEFEPTPPREAAGGPVNPAEPTGADGQGKMASKPPKPFKE